MKILSVEINRDSDLIVIKTSKNDLTFPLKKLPREFHEATDIKSIFVDEELGNEAVTLVTNQGLEESVHLDSFLEFNKDPEYYRSLALYELNLLLIEKVSQSKINKTEIAEALGTSLTQLYRILNTSCKTKTLDQVVKLLAVLGHKVDFSLSSVNEIRVDKNKQASIEGTSNVLKFLKEEDFSAKKQTSFDSLKLAR